MVGGQLCFAPSCVSRPVEFRAQLYFAPTCALRPVVLRAQLNFAPNCISRPIGRRPIVFRGQMNVTLLLGRIGGVKVKVKELGLGSEG